LEDFRELCIDEEASLLEALKELDKTSRKVLFVESGNKLVAALTDGDIRRWIIEEKNFDAKVKEFANYHPVFIYEKDRNKRDIDDIMRKTYSNAVPIVNDNMEIVDIIVNPSVVTVRDRISSEIPVVINAGGKGTRLYPYTKILPKPLIPIGDIPISEHIINRFNEMGVKDFYMIVNEKKDMIKAYYSSLNSQEWNLTFADEEMPLGTGGGLSLLRGKIHNTFIFINCDTLVLEQFSKILLAHKSNNNLITVICAKFKFTIPYGIVETHENIFDEIREKPQMFFDTNVGCYIIEPELLDIIPDNRRLDFTDIIKYCKKQGYNIGTYLIEQDDWLDMGQFDSMNEMKKKLRVE
jgi:dTDP-glucose pyrophosphorylase